MGNEHRPDLFTAINDRVKAQQEATDEAGAPERERREQQVSADAALYGTAGWEGLSDARRARAAHFAARQGGGDDAA